MTSTLVTEIGELVTNSAEYGDDLLGIRADAAIVHDGESILWVGDAAAAPEADERVELGGRTVIPGFVDSHSHLVFAGDRSAEFTARMTGQRYDGGGISVSMAATRAATDEQLREAISARVAEMRSQGTTTVEIKSGYGLTVADEARALRIASEFTDETTFLGGHVVPPEMHTDRAGYVDLVCGEMLQAALPYARWVDVFCEPHSAYAFTEEESRQILTAGRDAGLDVRVHANQLGHGPGVQLAVELGAASVDHCTYLDEADLEALVGSETVATLLPGVEFSTRSPYPNARKLLDSGAAVALATDCNPGTCFSTSMPTVIGLAVREMGMSPQEALRAATLGAAKALRRRDIGRIEPGMRADLAVLDAPTHVHLAYRFGVPIARTLTASG
ncbi:imidazolonepropionase [Dermacoccaceae bacterium W4C1]